MSKIANSGEVQIVRINFISSVPCWRYRHVSSPIWRFYWNPTEGALLRSRGETVELTPDTVVLVPPKTPFSTESTREFSHFYVHFNIPMFCQPDARKIWQLPSEEVILPGFRSKLHKMSGQQLFWIASSIIQAALAQLPEDIFSTQNVDEENLFEKAIALLDKDPSISLSDRELAARCGTSVNTLRRQFAQSTGLTAYRWQLNRKMEKAVQYLMHDCLGIKETADMLGFADRYHFSKAFKLYFGISPAQFVKCGGIPSP